MNLIKCDICETTTRVIDADWYDLHEYGKHFCCVECLHVWIEKICKKNIVDRANKWLYTDRRFYTSHMGLVVVDQKTGLMWDNRDLCKKYTHDEAMREAETMSVAGYTDWRLPTIEELVSIVDYSKYNPAIDNIFNCQSSRYWLSTTYALNIAYAWAVNFNDGGVNANTKTNTFYVRCCRTMEGLSTVDEKLTKN